MLTAIAVVAASGSVAQTTTATGPGVAEPGLLYLKRAARLKPRPLKTTFLKQTAELRELQLLQLRDFARDLHSIAAVRLARVATAAGVDSASHLGFS